MLNTNITDNILDSIKKMLGLDTSDDSFDVDIVININSTFDFLVQLGVDSFYKFAITTGNEKWSDYIDDKNLYKFVETYVYLKVKDYFDPPTSGVLREAMERQIKELEYRINLMAAEKEVRKITDTDSSEWLGIINFIKAMVQNGVTVFWKGMSTFGLSAEELNYFRTMSIIYPFSTENDRWTWQSDNGERISFLCTAGEHEGRDYAMDYTIYGTHANVTEYISTPNYEFAQDLDRSNS